MSLSEIHLQKIKSDFSDHDIAQVKHELAKLSPSDTMGSEYNLNNAIGAILDLSGGDIEELCNLVDAARKDFRDVIYWWMIENKKAEHPE